MATKSEKATKRKKERDGKSNRKREREKDLKDRKSDERNKHDLVEHVKNILYGR